MQVRENSETFYENVSPFLERNQCIMFRFLFVNYDSVLALCPSPYHLVNKANLDSKSNKLQFFIKYY